MTSAERLQLLAQSIAASDEKFFTARGHGAGNIATNNFMNALRIEAHRVFGNDFAERKICGRSGLCVDYYFPEERTVVEIALGLKNPKTEFEKDVLKVIMAKEAGYDVERLVFICKPGGIAKCAQAGRRDVIAWLTKNHGVEVSIVELRALAA